MGSKQENSSNNKKKTNIGAPKNFLIPILLLHLREWNSHGYELMEKLTKFGIDSLDHGNFYRLLRQLEKDSLVTSVWDTTSGGPAKRIYSITESGEQYLDLWANSLSEYQKMLNQFFNLYNPFYSSMRSTSSTSKKEAEVSKEKEKSTTKEEVAATTAKKATTTTRSTAKTASKTTTTRRTTKPRATRTSRTTTSKATTSTATEVKAAATTATKQSEK